MSSRSLHQPRAVDGGFVAELADFGVADDEDGFVFAQLARESLSEFGFVPKAFGIVHIGRLGVAGEEQNWIDGLVDRWIGGWRLGFESVMRDELSEFRFHEGNWMKNRRRRQEGFGYFVSGGPDMSGRFRTLRQDLQFGSIATQ